MSSARRAAPSPPPGRRKGTPGSVDGGSRPQHWTTPGLFLLGHDSSRVSVSARPGLSKAAAAMCAVTECEQRGRVNPWLLLVQLPPLLQLLLRVTLPPAGRLREAGQRVERREAGEPLRGASLRGEAQRAAGGAHFSGLGRRMPAGPGRAPAAPVQRPTE
ncbi:hypothetical protein EYF80_033001 [Liparis tanakae]|uniref:Uncharacterized protein n=1 Tax=Liparis tanakae TaxID=230148 RepID=A0A4Z2GVH4_9TELE|nr:hypothetical protein EYF80_033001 [Liparis tanakae]